VERCVQVPLVENSFAEEGIETQWGKKIIEKRRARRAIRRMFYKSETRFVKKLDPFRDRIVVIMGPKLIVTESNLL
jgi:hypothetical protein